MKPMTHDEEIKALTEALRKFDEKPPEGLQGADRIEPDFFNSQSVGFQYMLGRVACMEACCDALCDRIDKLEKKQTKKGT